MALMLLGLSLAASGHASSAPPTWLARPAVWLHALAIAMWIGSLLPLAYSLQDATDPGPLNLFSRLVPLVLFMLFVSGAILIVVQFDKPSSMWLTAYGQVLAFKLALVIVLLGLGAYNRYRLTGAVRNGQFPARRAMRRIIYVECALALAILSVVALWRFTPPPRALISTPASSAQITAHIHSNAAMADLSLAPSLHADSAMLTLYLSNTDLSPLLAQEVDVAFFNPRAGIEPIVFSAHRANDGTWQVSDMELPRQKVWHVRIDALVSDFERISLETTLELHK